MQLVSLQGNTGNGAAVDSQGRLAVSAPDGVATSPMAGSVLSSPNQTVTTTSGTLVAANVDRVAIQIMNLDATNSIHISFSGVATANHIEISPGQTYQFPANAAFTGLISAIAIGASVIAAIEEFLSS